MVDCSSINIVKVKGLGLSDLIRKNKDRIYSKMPRFGLTIKAEVENLALITLAQPQDYQFSIRFKCTNCQEDHEKDVVFSASDEYPHASGKGESNIVMKCTFCSSEGSANVLVDTLVPYSPLGLGENDDPVKKTSSKKGPKKATSADGEHVFVEIEARNMAPISWQAFDGWTAKGLESKTTFDNINLEDEWADYDDKADEAVVITDIVTGVTGRV